MSQYVVGDIHGCNNTFNTLLQTLNIKKGDELYLLGDYIDRGPNSKGVIDTIFRLRNEGVEVTCLEGNHESMLLDAYKNRENEFLFLRNGGKQTLDSFGCDHMDDLPIQYIRFFQSLKYYHEVDNYILVHAGLNFIENDPFIDTESMMWIRNWYGQIDYNRLGNRLIIHGHTPISLLEMIEQCENIDTNRYVNLDGGCYKNRYLCAFEMVEKKLIVQKCIDEIGY